MLIFKVYSIYNYMYVYKLWIIPVKRMCIDNAIFDQSELPTITSSLVYGQSDVG